MTELQIRCKRPVELCHERPTVHLAETENMLLQPIKGANHESLVYASNFDAAQKVFPVCFALPV